DTTARGYSPAAGELLIGLRFRPGAGGGGLGVPLDAVLGRQVDAPEVDRAFDLDGDLAPPAVVTALLAAAADRRPDQVVLAAAPRVADRELGGPGRELRPR